VAQERDVGADVRYVVAHEIDVVAYERDEVTGGS
jgi:hypothetical protein